MLLPVLYLTDTCDWQPWWHCLRWPWEQPPLTSGDCHCSPRPEQVQQVPRWPTPLTSDRTQIANTPGMSQWGLLRSNNTINVVAADQKLCGSTTQSTGSVWTYYTSSNSLTGFGRLTWHQQALRRARQPLSSATRPQSQHRHCVAAIFWQTCNRVLTAEPSRTRPHPFFKARKWLPGGSASVPFTETCSVRSKDQSDVCLPQVILQQLQWSVEKLIQVMVDVEK